MAIVCRVEFVGVIPGLEEPVTNGICSCLVSAEVIEVKSSPGESILDMVHDLPLDRLDVTAKIGTHKLPHLLSASLVLVIFELRPVEYRLLVVLEVEFRALSLHGRLSERRCTLSGSFLSSW